MKSNILPWAIVGVLGVLLLWSLNTDSREPVVITERHTDTLTIVKHDTVEVTRVVTKVEKEPADTVYVTVRDSIPVPILRQEYTFSEPNLFDFRVRGYMVDFLDAKVYPKTVYETIYEQNTTTVTKYRSSLFVSAHLERFSDTFIPSIGVSLSLKGRWLIGAKIGLIENEPLYGGYVGYNILQK
jgi:hypothetical protein